MHLLRGLVDYGDPEPPSFGRRLEPLKEAFEPIFRVNLA